MSLPPSAEQLDAHRRLLWGVSYRILGVAADADEVVQETFVRALERAPTQDGRPLRPWLVTVAANLARDRLRYRRRRQPSDYVGPWVPVPVDLPDESALGPEARYSLLESASLAFLYATEVLTPGQRAALVLSDVYGLSGAEVAGILDTTPQAARALLHRGRRALAAYDADRAPPSDAARQAARVAMAQMFASLMGGDVPGALDWLREDAVALTDAGGHYTAARQPVVGAEKVVRFFTNIAAPAMGRVRIWEGRANGMPAWLGVDPDPPAGRAPRWVTALDIGADGRVRRVFSIQHPHKLDWLDWSGDPGAA